MTPIIPFRPAANDLIIQLGIAVDNLKNVPLLDLAKQTLINEDDEPVIGIMALQHIALEITQICLAAATLNYERAIKQCK